MVFDLYDTFLGAGLVRCGEGTLSGRRCDLVSLDGFNDILDPRFECLLELLLDPKMLPRLRNAFECLFFDEYIDNIELRTDNAGEFCDIY